MNERFAFWWIYTAGWLPYFGLHLFFTSQDLPIVKAVAFAASGVVPFAVFGIAIVYYGRRPWAGGRRGAFFAVQTAAAFSYAVVSTAGTVGLYALIAWLADGVIDGSILQPQSFLLTIFLGLVFYATITGAVRSNEVLKRLREQEARAARAEAQRAQAEALRTQAELRALRAQLNPHFLFNTLHTLLALVRRDQKAAEEALEQFGELLHYSLGVHQDGREDVPFAEEWEFVRNYLALEKLRLGERLHLELDVDTEVLDCTVPAFSLQPLVGKRDSSRHRAPARGWLLVDQSRAGARHLGDRSARRWRRKAAPRRGVLERPRPQTGSPEARGLPPGRTLRRRDATGRGLCGEGRSTCHGRRRHGVSLPRIVRCLIVEDEPLARQVLWELVEEVDWLDAVGEAEDGPRAVDRIDSLRPDLVFLDVEMPGLSGLEVLETVRHRPAVVFTTAYNRYAVTAFELEAIDYLVKPFGRKRFQATLERVRRKWLEPETLARGPERVRAALGEGPLRRLFARLGDRIVPIPVAEIVHIEASDDYAVVHAGGRSHLLNLTLTQLEERLDPERFWRVHRSHIVNLDCVEQMRPYDDRRLVLLLKGGAQVIASRSGSQRLRELIG